VSLGSVDVTSLDAWWDAHGRNEKITILKVDCEGKDPDVLLGAEGLISQGLVDYIFWEYSQFWYDFGLAAAQVVSC
jgi:FkbM family methyltransferase